MADDVAYLRTPASFRAVGQFYLDFPPADDEEVVRLLQASSSPIKASAEAVEVGADDIVLRGDLEIPKNATGLVIFVHGSGSNCNSPRNRHVAHALHSHGLATLLLDLLTEDEPRDISLRFDIPRLTARLDAA